MINSRTIAEHAVGNGLLVVSAFCICKPKFGIRGEGNELSSSLPDHLKRNVWIVAPLMCNLLLYLFYVLKGSKIKDCTLISFIFIIYFWKLLKLCFIYCKSSIHNSP